MFEKTKEKNQIKKDLNRRYEILDNLGREITNKSVELKNLEENISNLQDKLARLQSELGPYESLEAIEKQRRELNQLAEEVGGYTELKEQVAKLKSEKKYLESPKFNVKDIIFARYNIIDNEEIHDSVFIIKRKGNVTFNDNSIRSVIEFNEIGGIHSMIYVPTLGKSVFLLYENADVDLIDYVSYIEICSALGIELKEYITYEEIMNILNSFRNYTSSAFSLTDTLNEIRNSRVNNTELHR